MTLFYKNDMNRNAIVYKKGVYQNDINQNGTNQNDNKKMNST